MYGAEQQILEEEIKTELECQNESLRLSGSGWAGDTHSMQNMIENFLFIICNIISLTKYAAYNGLSSSYLLPISSSTHTRTGEF